MEEKDRTDIVPSIPGTRISNQKPFGEATIQELTGVTSRGGDVVLVNLNRAAMVINCGSKDDFANSVAMCHGIKAAIWDEEQIELALGDRYTLIKYSPPTHPLAKIFFEEQKSWDDNWKGIYKPVLFTKKDLLNFLNHPAIKVLTPAVAESIQKMRLRESVAEADVISLEEDSEVRTVEEKFETNVPKKFQVIIPVTPDYSGVFNMEVTVQRPSERMERDAKSKKFALTCTNVMEIKRAAMCHVLDAIPKEIPRIYGTMKIKDREW